MSDTNTSDELTGFEIAIIGMAGRFPKARNIEQFWQNLCDGVEAISFFSDDELLAAGVDPALLSEPNTIKASGYLEDIELFDASFFGFSPREASMMDPQQRIFLECSWEALENAGYTAEKYGGTIGVYAGVGFNSYMLNNLDIGRQLSGSAEQYQQLINNDREFFSTRVSYKLNLTGPSITVQTACSTSLVATHLACQALISGECDMALAGGASIHIPQKTTYTYQEGGVLSPDGHCRPFDAKAQGTVVSSGAGAVVLKRLADALADGDSIYAVIKGSAINNDGSSKAGYTAPSREGQARVIRAALRAAEVAPDTIGYIETHGTGTLLGDPIEIAGLTQAFQSQRTQFCAIGSLKSNVGHMDTAAGVAGLIKAALALRHQQLPPSLNFSNPNPTINFASTPFYVNSKLSAWAAPRHPRRAAVSAFGIGGTNAHIVLEEAPTGDPSDQARPWQLLTISANSPAALNSATQNLAAYLRQNPGANLADIAYTLQLGRKEFSHRRVLVSNSTSDAAAALAQPNPQRAPSAQAAAEPPPVIFMFPGQGPQHIHMAAELYRYEPVFREQIDRCAELLQPYMGLDIRSLLFPTADNAEAATAQLNQTAITQPILFSVEYALAQLWIARGVKPSALIGHSAGEYVAACVAGVFSLEDGLRMLYTRGQLMQQMPAGRMMAVPLPASEVEPLLPPLVSIAAINNPAMCVVSGPIEAVKQLEQILAERGTTSRNLYISHASHSSMMEPIVDRLSAQFAQIRMHPPQIPYISNVSGTWITAEQATDPSYWGRHLRQTVRFADGLQELFKYTNGILVEVGPGMALSTFARRHPQKTGEIVVINSLPRAQDQQSDLESFLIAAGKIWMAGTTINWQTQYEDEKRQRLALPTYPFERQRYWIQARAANQREPIPLSTPFDEPEEAPTLLADLPESHTMPRTPIEQSLAAIWRQLLGVQRASIHDNFFDLGGDSLLAIELIASIRRTLGAELSTHSLLQAPTIALLAEQIGPRESHSAAQAHDTSHSLLVPIQPTGQKRPLFLIHPVGGGVYIYRDLVQQIGRGRPVYGIQAQGLDGSAEPIESIEAMAALYISLIRSIQPEGPYLLGGSSFGGIVSFEIAQQLRAAGQQVHMLVMIDSPDIAGSAQQLTDDAIIVSAALNAGAGRHGFVEQIQQSDPAEQLRLSKLLLQELQQTDSTEAAEALRLFHLVTIHLRAMRVYQPHSYNGSEIIFFRAIERNQQYPPNPERGWVDVAAEGIAIYDIPGDHISMNQAPNVIPMAGKLKKYLDRIGG